MENFDAILKEATARVGKEYFQLPIVGSPIAYRERVYCYELYHQLRLRWPSGCKYALNGEIDKRKHPYFVDDGWAPKPDFLIHVPGTDDNYAAIEVKTAGNLRTGDIKKDFNTLLRLRSQAGYRRAIHLVFGTLTSGTADVPLREVEIFAGIELWSHKDAGSQAEQMVGWSQV